MGTVIGAGIFITSKGVAEYAGSPGLCLIIWAVTGFYAFLQAWGYAELATIMPVAGGDYSYCYQIGGDLPAFVVGWAQLIVNVPATCGAVSQSAGLYIAKATGHEDNLALRTLIALLVLCKLFSELIYFTHPKTVHVSNTIFKKRFVQLSKL